MASFIKQVNSIYSFDDSRRKQLQNLDGYSPTIFYDFGDYINLMLEQNAAPESMKNEFEMRLNSLVPYKTNTAQFYTATRGPLNLNRYSGITTSDPSISQMAADKNKTKWYYATH